MPEFGTAFGGSFRRIVQTPGGVSIFYDIGQGQGWQRNIVMNGSPHLPAAGPAVVGRLARPLGRQHAGRRRHELQPEERLSGLAREPAPRRALDDAIGADTLEYTVTIEDPTVWTRPWTVKQEFTQAERQGESDLLRAAVPRGELRFPSMLLAARLAEKAFAEGRGPHPATKDNATDFVGVEENPLQIAQEYASGRIDLRIGSIDRR